MVPQLRSLTCLMGVLALGSFSLSAAVQIAELPQELGAKFKLSKSDDQHVSLAWQAEDESWRQVSMHFTADGAPLLSFSTGLGKMPISADLTPVFSATVGSREQPPAQPPGMSIFNTFFDNPGKRPHETFQGAIKTSAVRFERHLGHRVSVIFDGVTVGPFAGELWVTAYAGSTLLQVEAVVSTKQEKVAYVFEAGLRKQGPLGGELSHLDTEGRWQRTDAATIKEHDTVAVRHRAVFASQSGGTVALFPAPHQFFFPVDSTDNNRTIWREPGGFGLRQDAKGGGNYVPWVNGPPDTKQRLGYFLLVNPGDPGATMNEVLRYTRGDSYAELPGHTTFTSHYHMAIAIAAMERVAKGLPQITPEFVKMFKDLGVRMVHLGEFHGDGHPRDPGPLRLPEMKAMFDECKRLSDERLLMLPGEEANEHLGVRRLNAARGHWMCFFPKPVYWTMVRAEGQPFSEAVEGYGTVYHVGNKDDMMRLLETEQGLAWTAHARIKASSWSPDYFRMEDFYKSARWLGAAFKAMPADLSREKLGERCLDLLSDMANWGDRKYLPGEVDVFKLNHTHELYGHMNINYMRMDHAPKFEDGWKPVLEQLRAGAFFTTTGEVLIKDFKVGGKLSGETFKQEAGASPQIAVDLEWTFPLQFAEVVSGDGKDVFRERVDLRDTGAFGKRELKLEPAIQGRKWVRVEVWDIARNGAYTQPVWLE